MLLDRLAGQDAVEVVERDDGFVMGGAGSLYFAPVRRWPSTAERRALRLVRGRVLDVGCGAGRVLLELQARGREVVGIDPSPLSVEVCRRRGGRDVRVARLEDVDASFGLFDTVVMFGANLSLLGGRAKGRRLLRLLHTLTGERGRIVGSTLDVYDTEDESHLAYHRRNRAHGRMSGQLRLRIRYRDLASPWFDYLFLSQDELRDLVDGTGWRLARTIVDPPGYVAVLEKIEGSATRLKTPATARVGA